MRFSAERSPSPSPVRGATRKHKRHASVFSARSPSEDESDAESDVQSESSASSTASSSSDSFFYASETEVPPSPKKRQIQLDPAEERKLAASIASIRLRVTHHDAYEEWEKQTKMDAFQSARRSRARARTKFSELLSTRRTTDEQQRRTQHEKETAEVALLLKNIELERTREEARLRADWKARDSTARERVEKVIREEEAKEKAILEQERKKREEAERKKREEEERKAAEEKKRTEEEDRRKQEEDREREETNKKKEEEAKKKKKEEEERQARAQDDAERAQRDKADEEGRKALGNTTATQDWIQSRQALMALKQNGTRAVKANKEMKSVWSKARRAITAKVGQLVDSSDDINRISQQIFQIARPNPPHPRPLYHAILSSLAKAILLQAEAEVTASPAAALPLARVAANLLGVLDNFADIFHAKLVQRAGCWAVPLSLASVHKDLDGTPVPPGSDERRKRWIDGKRLDGEGETEFGVRVSGMMRVYFGIMCVKHDRPLDTKFASPRLWTWCARLLSDKGLFASEIAPSVLHAALDVGGAQALEKWGKQWVKLLETTYKGIIDDQGDDKKELGGTSVESLAARARMRIAIERIMKEAQPQ